MLRAIIAVASIAACLGSASGFSVNMSSSDLRSATKKYAVIDLAVGEVGYVSFPSVCIAPSGGLFLVGTTALDEGPSEYSANIKVQRGPSDTVALTASNGSSMSGRWEDEVFARVRGAPACTFYDAMASEPQRYLEVTLINGAESLSDLVGTN